MKIGDIVVIRSYGKDITFKIIDVREKNGEENIILKGLSIRIIADSTLDDLELAEEDSGSTDKILNTRVKESIRKAINIRGELRDKTEKSTKIKNKDELIFGRPGRILHIDGDSEYMETCLKVYKQLSLDAVGKAIPESEQPDIVVDLVREVKPDIVVLTGHDSVVREPKDYLDLNNYRNSKYDELVIFAGACQSCYERILDVGANFASSPNRVLIHCLDPVFVCEKIAYTRIDKVVSITEVIENTITGIKGVGGLQTRGKYREGYPKSWYI